MEIKKQGNQKVVYLGDSKYSGIDITINKGRKSLTIGGWYDGCVGIDGEEISLDTINSWFK